MVDDWDDPGKAGEAKKVINTAHILHFTFPELLDKGGFPTVINLIGGMMPDPKNPNHDVVYAHGYVPKEVLVLFSNPEDHPKVTVTASKVYSYYCGYTPFSHGITFRSAVINGHASLLPYNEHISSCKEEVKDDEIIKENEKLWALFNIVTGMFGSEDRWNDTRRPFKDEEVKRVPVLRVEIDKSTSRLHERLGVLGYEPDWETSDGRKYWEGAIPIWETYGDPIKGKTDRAFPDYLNKVFTHRRESNEQVAVEEATRPFVPKK
ncbi:FMN-binding split barrel-like protein [Penicillium expansum]|uniref:FMN-binding split barrel-like protein n=1 Tax=Penicillium expansum TaxID=27334 RepID=A0A0A2L070_PENEN|nr:FMN-binding split barrel-like protein [Penicillium expansum]KAJ5492032.1 FMN-binding split barrel-like protein [Penicillium expansum]KGO41863.1 FMN-binding split barrel-like protein [Penicillium expansum]KGO56684.1 FMN-binding split barrel-like protein [Penicillium expansum]KGO70005.1 FMN-binding split barrel-like protein [Penicillium expansum]